MTTRSIQEITGDILNCANANIPHQMWLTNKRIRELEQHFYVAKVRGKVPLESPTKVPAKTKWLCTVELKPRGVLG